MARQELIGDVPGNVLGMMADLSLKLKQGSITPWQFSQFLKGKNPFVIEAFPLEELLTIQVDYEQNCEVAVAAGAYGLVNNVVKEIPWPPKRGTQKTVEVCLIRFPQLVSTEEVITDLTRQHLWPANLPELLAIGAQHGRKQIDSPIVALGASINDKLGTRLSPYISRSTVTGRILDLIATSRKWSRDWRFAAVRL